MRRYAPILSLLMVISLAAPSVAAAKKVTKPSAPTVASITSTPVKKGKVNLTVVVTLGADNGGAAVTQTRISAGGKSCTAKKTKTSCTIKGIKSGKAVTVTAKSKNKKGFGTPSQAIPYTAGSSAYALATNGTAAPVKDRIDCSLKDYITPCYCTKYFPETTEYFPVTAASENPCSQKIEGITKTWEWYCSFWGLSYSVTELDCIQSTSTPTPTPSRTPTPTPSRTLLPYSYAIANLVNGLTTAQNIALRNSLARGDSYCGSVVYDLADDYSWLQDQYRLGVISEGSAVSLLQNAWTIVNACR